MALEFAIRLTADGSAYVNGVRVARQETEGLGDTARKASSDVDSMTGSLTKATAIGQTFGHYITEAIDGITRWAASTISQAANLKDLSDATGSSVESLSRLNNSFKVSGVSTEVLSTALQRLSVNLSRQDDDGRRASRALEALGISTKDPAQALEQLATRLSTYADGANKAALVQEILGRGAQVLLPALKDLANASDIQATVTAHQAEEAEKLEKGLRTLSAQSSALGRALLEDVVPPVNDLIQGFIDARQHGEGLVDTFNRIAKRRTFDHDDVTQLRTELDKLQEKQALFDARPVAYMGWLISTGQYANALALATGGVRNEIELLQNTVKQAAYIAPIGNADRVVDRANRQAPGVPDAAKVGAARQAYDELASTAERWRQTLSSIDSQISTQTTKGYEELSVLLHEGRISLDEFNKGVDYLIDHDTALNAAVKQLNDTLSSFYKLMDGIDESMDPGNKAFIDRAEATQRWTESLTTQNQQLQREAETFGMSARQAIQYNAAKERTRIAALDISNQLKEEALAAVDLNEKLQLGKVANDEFAEAQRKAADQAREIDDGFRSAFENIGENGVKAFKDIGKAIKQYVLDAIYQLTLRPIVLQFAGSLTGLGTAGAAQAVGLSGGGLGGIGSSLGNLFGGSSSGGGLFSGLGSIFGGAGSYFGATGASLGASEAVGISGAAAGSSLGALGAGAAGLLGTIGTVLPYVGIALAIASALGAFSHGGPKGGGFAAIGSQTGLLNVDRDNNRYYTPNDQDQKVSDIVSQVSQSFQQTLTALGGKGNATFGLGFDTDPNGKADNRISAGAVVNGRTVYDARNVDVGRDNDQLQAQLTLQSQRALLAALQASDLPKEIATVLNKVVASSATDDQIQSALKMAGALKQLMDAVDGDPIKDANEAWRQLNRSSTQALKEQGDALRTLAHNTDPTIDSTTALAQATQAYRTALTQTLVQIRQVQQAIGQMFAGTREQLETSGLSGQSLYDYYRQRANARTADLSSNDPATVQAAANDINRFLMAAFGALSPEDQASAKGPLLEYLNGLDTYVQKHLDDLFNQTGADGKGPLDDVSAAIGTAADNFTVGANTIGDAADSFESSVGRLEDVAEKMNQAADRLQTITVTMRPSPEVNG